MKKTLLLKRYAIVCILALFAAGPLFAQTKLVFVTDTLKLRQGPGEDVVNDTVISEQHIIDMFLEDGYDVTVMQFPPNLSTADPAIYDELDMADLIYIGRPVPSVTFQDPEKPFWNDLYPPIMTENMWGLRNSRMNWFNTTDIAADGAAEDSAIIYASVEDPDDEVFDNLDDVFPDLDWSDSIPFWYGQWDCISPPDAGNGTVMAALAGGQPCWVRFEDKTEFYPGSVDEPAGERVYFGLGHDTGGGPPQFYSHLTEVGIELKLREAARLSGHLRGQPGVGVENHRTVASKVYFNYSSKQLVVEMDNLRKVEVIDLSGRMVFSANSQSNRMFVDMGSAERGIYLVKLTDINQNFATTKFLK